MKRIKLFLSALTLSMSSLLLLAAPHAFAATRTWDGGGSDNNMTTAANWSGDVAPSAGDDLVFPSGVTDRTITNDFTAATSFNSITFNGAAVADSNYTLTGNSITLVAGITHSMTTSGVNITQTIDLNMILDGNQTFATTGPIGALDIGGNINLGSNTLTFNVGDVYSNIDGVISGTGGLTQTTSGEGILILRGDNTYSGVTTVNAGQLAVGHENGLGTAAGGTTVADGASLYIFQASGDVTYDEPLTLAGTGIDGSSPTLSVGNSFGAGGTVSPPYSTSTFSGAVTLQSNVKVSGGYRNGKITGAITGNYSISLLDSSTGTFQIASSSNGSATENSTLKPATKETTYDQNQPSTDILVNTNETAIVTGTYGDVNINPGGILKGTGTVGNVVSSGTIAPGLSPGCLNTGNLVMNSGSTYDFEVGGTTVCTQYDQITVTGTVQAGGTLNLILYNGFKPVAGQKYVIISNDGSDAVVNNFDGLAQSATFTVSGYTFSISYTGGDGNDVELTVTAVPPNTGFALVANNPFLGVGAMLAAAGVLAFIARRQLRPVVLRRRR